MKTGPTGSDRMGSSMFYISLLLVALLALTAAHFLKPDGYNIHPRPSKQKSTSEALQTLVRELDSYRSQFGEYPKPSNPDEQAEILPGKPYRIGAAKCLYQALSGDGEDAIKGIPPNGHPSQSDGKIGADETKYVVMSDIPRDMIRKVGDNYILVDAIGLPFQYVVADGGTTTTINSHYDLWSYGEDDQNTLSTSKDTKDDPKRATKWIKNW